MKRFVALWRSAFFIGAVLLPSTVLAQSEEVRLRFSMPTVFASFSEPDADAGYACEPPTKLVAIEFSQDLKPSYFELAPFLRAELEKQSVVIRRAGTVEEEPKGPSWDKKVSTARFTQGYVNREEQLETTDLALSGTMYFCDYSGFPEFAGARISISGEIGDFSVSYRQTIEAGSSDLNLFYRSRKRLSADQSEALPPKRASYETKWNDVIGRLEVDYENKSVPFEPIDREGRVLVKVSLRGFLQITQAADNP